MSLPDDVAEYLDKHPNSSAIVTEAVRARIDRAATTRALQEAAGFSFTPEGQAWARSALRPLTSEEKVESQRYFEALEAGHLPEPR